LRRGCESNCARFRSLSPRVRPCVLYRSCRTRETEGSGGDFAAGILLPIFRATGWAGAKYPTEATKLAAFASTAADATVAIGAEAAIAVTAFTAARAVADAAFIATAGAAAVATAAVTGDVATYTAAATAAFWSAVSLDATRVEESVVASVIAGSPLWLEGQPDELRSLWQEMKAALLAGGQDWEVWTDWYEARLEGRVRDEEGELAYVRIEKDLWAQGPAIVNAEIKKRLTEDRSAALTVTEAPDEAAFTGTGASTVPLAAASTAISSMRSSLSVSEPTPPAPVENVPSAVSFGWTSRGTITVVAGQQNWPVLPFKGSEQDHANRLEACRVLATDTARLLRSGEWNARQEYSETLDDYVAYLPRRPDEGNFLLADAQARIIRAMFAADVKILPPGLAAKLQIFLEQHIGLRAYYPATEDFYESVRPGYLESPLPMDAVEGFIHGVRDNTPALFEPNVAGTLENTAQPIPTISPVALEAPISDIGQPAPPPDPLGEVDPEKVRRFTLLSGMNALWKVLLLGETVGKAVEGWSKAKATLGPFAAQCIEHLRSILPGGGN
jgi:hypothetical protein